MEQQMSEYMSADTVAQMQERMGMSYGEMGEHMTAQQNDSAMDEMMDRGMPGMGCQ